MKRYADTFFRYCLLLLIPIVVLPAGEYMLIRHPAPQFTAYTNIYVTQPVGDGSYQFTTPAQSETDNLNQWLQSALFDSKVAMTSPIYAKKLGHTLDPQTAAFNDLSKTVHVAAVGDNLVTVSYQSLDAQLALQVVRGLLDVAASTRVKVGQWQQTIVSDYYQSKLRSAQQQEQQSAQDLADYIRSHGISPADYPLQLDSDPTFATLYNRNKSDQQNVNSLEQQVSANPIRPDSISSALAAKQAYFVADQPTVVTASTSTKKKMLTYLGLALALGALLAGVLTVLLTATDRTMRYADEVHELLKLPVVAVVAHSAVLERRDPATEPKRLPGRSTAQLEQTG